MQTATIKNRIVNVRAAATVGSEKLFQLRRGTEVTIIEDYGNWYEIIVEDGRKGFLSKNLVEINSEKGSRETSSGSAFYSPLPTKKPGSILETRQFKKSTNWWIKSSTQMIVFEKKSDFNPLDSSENYRLVRDQYQSLSLLINRKNGKHKQGLAAGSELWMEDSTNNKLKFRISSLNYYWQNYWRFNRTSVGRQNIYTGFHYYKLDGISSEFKIGESSSLMAFAGLRVDTALTFDNPGNGSGYLQFRQNFGYRSHWFVGYERANLRDSLNANDLGMGANIKAGKKFIVKSKVRLSWEKSPQLTETKNRIQYHLNKKHIFYGGFNYFNPVFRDTLQAYYFDMFDYNKGYLGWRWRPHKKKDIYISGEGSVLSIHEVVIYHGKVFLTTRFLDLMAIYRLGDISDAVAVSTQFKYPVFNRLTLGTGVDYANMEHYYEGSKNFISYTGYCRFQPFNPLSMLVRIENRKSPFAAKDYRIVGNITLSHSSQKGRYFVWED